MHEGSAVCRVLRLLFKECVVNRCQNTLAIGASILSGRQIVACKPYIERHFYSDLGKFLADKIIVFRLVWCTGTSKIQSPVFFYKFFILKLIVPDIFCCSSSTSRQRGQLRSCRHPFRTRNNCLDSIT